MQVEQYISGNELPKKKLYQDRVRRIKKNCSDFNERNIVDYLRGIAYHFQLQT